MWGSSPTPEQGDTAGAVSDQEGSQQKIKGWKCQGVFPRPWNRGVGRLENHQPWGGAQHLHVEGPSASCWQGDAAGRGGKWGGDTELLLLCWGCWAGDPQTPAAPLCQPGLCQEQSWKGQRHPGVFESAWHREHGPWEGRQKPPRSPLRTPPS